MRNQSAAIGRRLLDDLNTLRGPAGPEKRPLLELLIRFRYVQTTNPRDKVYALRGLAIDGDRSPIPDYSQSVTQMYLEFAKFFLSEGHGLELIREAGLSKSSLDSPSWVVDWNNNARFFTCNYSRGNRWPATVELSNEADAEVELTDDSTMFSAIGAVIDTVTGTTSGMLPLGGQNDNHERQPE